jgi:hypothetical protein
MSGAQRNIFENGEIFFEHPVRGVALTDVVITGFFFIIKKRFFSSCTVIHVSAY